MKSVLFVCVENSCRSQMAEAFGKMLGAGVLECYSSGSQPSGAVNPGAIAAMAELGYDMARHHSKALTELPAITFDYVITMGCGDRCPAVPAWQRDNWEIPDPKYLAPPEFARVRDLIRAKVEDLIAACTANET